jgi:hypothetical protein
LCALEKIERHDMTVWMPGSPSGERQTNIEFKFTMKRAR